MLMNTKPYVRNTIEHRTLVFREVDVPEQKLHHATRWEQSGSGCSAREGGTAMAT